MVERSDFKQESKYNDNVIDHSLAFIILKDNFPIGDQLHLFVLDLSVQKQVDVTDVNQKGDCFNYWRKLKTRKNYLKAAFP
jgi:hypothetical protein